MLKLDYEIKRWNMVEPFIIAGSSSDAIDCVHVALTDVDGHCGRAETCGVDYHGESAGSICAELDAVRSSIEAGIDLEELQQLLPAGGARNGLDCALWDLHCQQRGESIWTLAEIGPAASVATVYTIGVVGPEHAAVLAARYADYGSLKVKADETGSLSTLQAIRQARPEVQIIVDANQSWTPALFQSLEPELIALDIALLEQPFAVNADDFLLDYLLDHQLDYEGRLKIAADESVQTTADLPKLAGRYDVLNIKLDKTGGMTEALRLARAAGELGFALMVGNNCGSSLAMAPAYVIAQLCDFVDLDGPLLQTEDVVPAMHYDNGQIAPPAAGGLWGGLEPPPV